jgi:phosphoribosylformylglycinamidine (FGAM) synthase PurS component
MSCAAEQSVGQLAKGAIHRIEVTTKQGCRDPVAQGVLSAARSDLGIRGLKQVRMAEIYYLSSDPVELTREKLVTLAEQLFCDPVVQEYSVDSPILKASWPKSEVRFLEGVTDNTGIAASEGAADVLGVANGSIHVRSARIFAFDGISEGKAREISKGLLANELVQRFEILK